MGSKQTPLRLYTLKLTLMHLKPAVWRRVQVPCDITLARLRDVIQVVMPREDAQSEGMTQGWHGPPGRYGDRPDTPKAARRIALL